MKIAISIRDAVFAEAERLARGLKKLRSRIYTEALTAYMRWHDDDAITQAFNHLCDVLDTRPEPMVDAAARRVLAGSKW